MSSANDLDALRPWASPQQLIYIDAVLLHGSGRAAAKALGVNKNTIQNSIDRVRKRAAVQGFSPQHDMTHVVPEPYVVKGTSTYYDSEGKPRAQWVKTRLDDDKREQMLRAAAEGLAADLPRLAPISATAPGNEKLCNLFTITDYHVGMLAWGVESGEDWDLDIAENTLVEAFGHMIASSPKAKTAVINQLGDFLHFDSLEAVTPTNRHLLDADSRFPKVVKVAVRLLRRVVDMALASHDEVVLVIAEGNHDIASSVWLQTMFSALYDKEPRITVNQSVLPYYVYQHGKVMLGFHHGHMKKNDGLPLHFAASYPVIWGATTKRYVHVGHRHHVEEKEHPGIKIVQHATLAARDAYAARGGWISERQMIGITYHSEFGEVARSTVTPEMLV